jgi:hypothetical protein
VLSFRRRYTKHLVYCVRVMSVVTRIGSTPILVQPTDVCTEPPEDEQVMLETCRGP